uniref:Uncharacterized protein n=1 Tax=Magallana gigas TaxID=29159 RepID=A0A8W8NUK8_MAGGI
MDTNCQLINGRVVCPPVNFVTPRMSDQESDECKSCLVIIVRLSFLPSFRYQYSIDGAGPPPHARVGSKEVPQTLHPSEEEGIGNSSKRTF